MKPYQKIEIELNAMPFTWLVTGAAGFIGSNLVEKLLRWNQKVIGIDNFSTGHKENLTQVFEVVGADKAKNFTFFPETICDMSTCQKAMKGVDVVLHQAAIGSVPRSIVDPIFSSTTNIMGTLNLLTAAKDAGVKRFVYASSSSVYGDHPALPKKEENLGNLLSPYALTKFVDELAAGVFHRSYGLDCIGLRYFNVFGPRQDPNGAYAAVIPLWIKRLIRKEEVFINGDGETSRDFCFVDNAIQANLLAATSVKKESLNKVFNIAYGERTTLNQLFNLIKQRLAADFSHVADLKPVYKEFRQGDIRHSLADISSARELLGYSPEFSVSDGLESALSWYKQNIKK